MKTALLSTLLLAALASPAFAGVPACTEANEGQTLLLEDGMGPAQVYVCHQGDWIPASSLPKKD
jgi:hypothetical protein